MSENQNIEYKQSWHDDYLKWVCGFANAIGGVIYISKTYLIIGYIDAWVRGTLKIINSCKEAGLPEPEIIEKEAGVMLALHKYDSTTDQVGGQDLILTKRQKEVLALIVENPLISRKQLAEKF